MDRTYEYGYRLPRFAADFYFHVRTEGPEPQVANARCLDISEEGIAARVSVVLAVGATVTLLLLLPGNAAAVSIPAKVVSQKQQDYGFAFLFPSQREREAVLRFVASLHAEPLRLGHPPARF